LSPKLRLKAMTRGVKLLVRDVAAYAALLAGAFSEVSDMGMKLQGVRPDSARPRNLIRAG
jgi:hypothetical protein